jgi:hypothetical protein
MNTSINKTGLLLLSLLSLLVNSCDSSWIDREMRSPSGSVQTFGQYLWCVGWLDGELIKGDDLEDPYLWPPLAIRISKIKNYNYDIAISIKVNTKRNLYCFPFNASYWELSTTQFKIKGSPFIISFDTPVCLSLIPAEQRTVYYTVDATIKGWIDSSVKQTKSQPDLNRFSGDIVLTWEDPECSGIIHELHINQFSDTPIYN